MLQRKEHLLLELKELLNTVIYLAVSFCVLATIKSVVLIQLGIHDFVHGYIKALIEALALSKIVMLAGRIPILGAFEQKSILLSSLYKSIVMAAIVFFGGTVEEKFFAKDVAQANIQQELVLSATHLLALFLVFYVLFVARSLDSVLGKGTLRKLLTQPNPLPKPANAEP